MQRNEKDVIRQRFKNHAIYKAIKVPCQEYEAQSKDFKISAEEVFRECMIALDEIRENPTDARFDFQDYWSSRYNEYREAANPNADNEEIVIAASITTLSVAICLLASDEPLHQTLTLLLMGQINEHYPNSIELQEKMTANIYRLGEEKFKASVYEYLKSDDFYSDEIDDLLDQLPFHETVETKDTGKNETLTLRQLLILLDVGFDIGFTPETTNVNAYSKLIALMTKGNHGSIRTTMNRLKNIDYNSRDVKEDVKYLASLVEPVKEELAIKLRNQIDNDY